MRVAVVSDIHGNLAALEAVFAALEGEPHDELWCLRDLVGYGARPNECCSPIEARASICLAGNHDLAARGVSAAGAGGASGGLPRGRIRHRSHEAGDPGGGPPRDARRAAVGGAVRRLAPVAALCALTLPGCGGTPSHQATPPPHLPRAL